MSARRIAVVLAMTIAITSAACTNKDDDVGVDSPTRKKATSATTPGGPAPGATAISVTLLPSQGALPALLKAEAAKAKSMSLKPFAEFRADWCGPCVAIEKSMDDPAMKKAFAGTYVVHLDVDDWGSSGGSLAGTGFNLSVIPIFYELDDNGKPTGRTIDGGAWGENVPENMAPPLSAFFHGK